MANLQIISSTVSLWIAKWLMGRTKGAGQDTKLIRCNTCLSIRVGLDNILGIDIWNRRVAISLCAFVWTSDRRLPGWQAFSNPRETRFFPLRRIYGIIGPFVPLFDTIRNPLGRQLFPGSHGFLWSWQRCPMRPRIFYCTGWLRQIHQSMALTSVHRNTQTLCVINLDDVFCPVVRVSKSIALRVAPRTKSRNRTSGGCAHRPEHQWHIPTTVLNRLFPTITTFRCRFICHYAISFPRAPWTPIDPNMIRIVFWVRLGCLISQLNS